MVTRAILLLSFMLSLAVPVAAQPDPGASDEILAQVQEAIRLYEEGRYAEAASELEFAATQMRQLQAGEISAALPAPLPGWEAREAETTAMSGAIYGATGASREYTRDGSRIEVQILGDSPMIQAVMMMLKNPVMMSASGGRVARIAGQKAVIQYQGDERSGEIQIVVANSVLVTLNGDDVSEEDLMAYAEAVDYDLIKRIAMGG